MKIISGSLKGRIIKGYDIEGTRPTMDRVKESLFGMIQTYISDKVVLDLFAGTGNLGFEAISNGAKLCIFNDKNKKCTSLIKENINIFNIESKAVVLNLDCKKALEYIKENNIKLDLVFLDPPYKDRSLNDVITYIHDNSLLNKNGIIVCEVDNLYLDVSYYEVIKERKYNDKYIIIYRN